MKTGHETDNHMLAICAWCKKIRIDMGDWVGIDDHVKQHLGDKLTHGICPECSDTVMNKEI
jgi:hypothetical protein